MIEKLFGEMNVHNIMHNGAIIALAIIIIAIIIASVTVVLSKKGMVPDKLKKLPKIVCIVLITVSLFIGLFTLIITMKYKTAVKRGAFTDDMTVKTMYEGIRYSPIEDELPEDLKGSIIIYYRFDCPDCHAIYEDLCKAVEGRDKVYWISSRSKQGKALLANYPVSEVPSAIYFREYTYGGALTYTKKVLYTTENGNAVLSKNGIERLIELQDSVQ